MKEYVVKKINLRTVKNFKLIRECLRNGEYTMKCPRVSSKIGNVKLVGYWNCNDCAHYFNGKSRYDCPCNKISTKTGKHLYSPEYLARKISEILKIHYEEMR